eukprot:9775774-Ditylum_brightwellii.AAC.1
MANNNAEAWTEEVGNKTKRFDKFNAFSAVPKSKVPKGFEKINGEHYFSDSIAAPVTNLSTVQIALVLLAMNLKWISMVVDVEGTFLQGKFENGKELYAHVPNGFD